MIVEKKFVQNFLSVQRNAYGQLSALFIIALCLFVSKIYWSDIWGLNQYLSASPESVIKGHEYWRLFTTTLVHGDLKHLLSNSFMLFLLMYFVTSFYGPLISLGLSFIMGGVINLFTISLYESNITLVGASGVVYYLWGFWLVLYLCIETQRSIISRLLRVGGVFFILLVPTTFEVQTSYTAHYSGFVLGLMTGVLYFLLNRKKIRAYEKWEYEVTYEEDEEQLYVDSIQ